MKVGDYVRTKKGSIAKVLGIDYYIEGNGGELSNIDSIYFDNVVDDIDKDIHSGVFQDCLKEYKSSPNIMDLIEEGDYVNSCKVYQNQNGKIVIGGINGLFDIQENCIYTIVTKEQFSQMEYRIGE